MAKQLNMRSQKQELSPTYDGKELISDMDSLQPILHLLNLGQALCNQSDRIVHNLSEEVMKATQQKAKLIIYKRKKDDQKEILASPFHIPVRFGDLKYGILLIQPDPLRPEHPILPFTVSLLLAQICGGLLHIAEQAVILQLNGQSFSERRNIDLTEREKEILILICRGWSTEKIACQLFISPQTVKRHKHNIYTKLNVHSEHQALLVAYFNNLFLPIEDL